LSPMGSLPRVGGYASFISCWKFSLKPRMMPAYLKIKAIDTTTPQGGKSTFTKFIHITQEMNF
jgi:hypothetical protein